MLIPPPSLSLNKEEEESDGDESQPTDEAANGDDDNDEEAANYVASDPEDDIALQDLNGTYNPDAADEAITGQSGALKVSITKDKNGSIPYNGETITADTTLYGEMSIDFHSSHKPTLEHPNVYYQLPDNISVVNKASATLYDKNGVAAGTWEIVGNKVRIKFSEEWLTENPSEISASFSFEFKLADQTKGDGEETPIVFPGTGTVVTIKTKDEQVNGSKWAANNGAYNAEDGTYTWIIKVSPSASGAKNLTITDTIGSNLTFVDGSFSMCDQNGNPTEETPDVSINGQVATIKLGDRAQGDYYVTYKTKISESALEKLKDNQEVDNVNNKASWTWGEKDPSSHPEVEANPTKVKYSMVSKSASGTNDDIVWTVKLNNGSLKADMSGYTFTDTLGDGHTFKAGTQYVVTDESGAVIASGDVDPSSSTLNFKLPDGIGKKTLTVTYHTAMTDTTSPDPVKNTVDVTPGDDKYPSGSGDGSYDPSDTRTYVSKQLENKSENGASATWSSIIYFSTMASSTDVSKVSWKDTIKKTPGARISTRSSLATWSSRPQRAALCSNKASTTRSPTTVSGASTPSPS